MLFQEGECGGPELVADCWSSGLVACLGALAGYPSLSPVNLRIEQIVHVNLCRADIGHEQQCEFELVGRFTDNVFHFLYRPCFDGLKCRSEAEVFIQQVRGSWYNASPA